MREINGNFNNIQKPEIRVDKKDISAIDNAQQENDAKIINDFSNPRAEALGRSQVMVNVDNMKNDVAFLKANPDAVEKAEAFFNMTYAHLLQKDVPNAYEKAAAMATVFARELAANANG